MWKSTIIGHLGADAEVKNFGQNNTPYICMRVAVDMKRGGNDTTEWFSLYMYYSDARSNLLKYLTKGTCVYAEGSPADTIYRTRDGIDAVSHSINVDKLELCGRPAQGANGGYDPTTGTYANQRQQGNAMDGSAGQPVSTPVAQEQDQELPF